MNKTFYLTGGAGRVITAIPALEKFAMNNPDNDFRVLVFGWESLFWGNPILQKRTFSAVQKGAFDAFIKNNELVVPEPYHCRSYYTQQKSMAECFDEIINQTDDHSDLYSPRLFTTTRERNMITDLLSGAMKEKSLSKVVVFQPYGSGMTLIGGRPTDPSNRSLDVEDTLYITKELSKHALVVYFGDTNFMHPMDEYSLNLSPIKPDLRAFMTAIGVCDYFVGVDSVGQHMARALGKPGTVIMGSTFEKNVSYPDYFNIFRNGIIPEYNPIRIGGIDCDLSDIANEEVMKFTKKQLDALVDTVISNLK